MQACVTKMKHLLMILLMKYEIIGSQHKIIFFKVVFYVYTRIKAAYRLLLPSCQFLGLGQQR